jgi:hypothetical protein
MEPITVGILIGVGATVALARGRQGLRGVVGWTARQIGWASSRVSAAVQETRDTARSEYERGRQTTDERELKLQGAKSNGRDANAS